jgi:hypothetical protein
LGENDQPQGRGDDRHRQALWGHETVDETFARLLREEAARAKGTRR